ncbi:hypothetical protein ACVJGD_004550 [Bradyrhizobium sp. USDA 10063]
MNSAVGFVLVIVAASLIWLGMPDKAGNSPRFLRFRAAPVVYPPLVLALLALGAAESIYSLLH